MENQVAHSHQESLEVPPSLPLQEFLYDGKKGS